MTAVNQQHQNYLVAIKKSEDATIQRHTKLLKGRITGFFWHLVMIVAFAAIIILKGTSGQAAMFAIFFLPILTYLLYLRFTEIRMGSLFLAKLKGGIYDDSLQLFDY